MRRMQPGPTENQACFISAGSGHLATRIYRSRGGKEEERQRERETERERKWEAWRGAVLSEGGDSSIPSAVGLEWKANGWLLVVWSPSQTTKLLPAQSPQMLFLSLDKSPGESFPQRKRQLHNCLVHGTDKRLCHQRERESWGIKACGSPSQSRGQLAVRWHAGLLLINTVSLYVLLLLSACLLLRSTG